MYFVLFFREEILNEFIYSGYLQSNFLVLCGIKFLKILIKVSVSILVISFVFLFLNALCQSNIEIAFLNILSICMFIIPDFSVIRRGKGYIEIKSSVYNIMMIFFMNCLFNSTIFSNIQV